jgi:RES domain
MTEAIGYRHAAWDTPWWVSPNRSAGRFNRPLEVPTQYLCLHPLGAAAEWLRHLGRDAAADLDLMYMRLWAATVDLHDLVRVSFGNAADFGLEPDELISDDYEPTQVLARRLRDAGTPGLVAPSAALPGTEIAVLFGPRVLAPYFFAPVDPLDQVATAHVAERSKPADEVVPFVRWFGEDHAGLQEWRATGTVRVLADPPVGSRS